MPADWLYISPALSHKQSQHASVTAPSIVAHANTTRGHLHSCYGDVYAKLDSLSWHTPIPDLPTLPVSRLVSERSKVITRSWTWGV